MRVESTSDAGPRQWLFSGGWALALLIAALIVCYPFRAAEELPHTPMTEDGFYMLTVARHLAQGHGISYDGVHPTDGVQPAVVFLYAPAFLVTHSFTTPLRLVMLAQIALFFATALVCGRTSALLATGARRETRMIATLLWLASYPVFRHSVNGLETGLYLLALSVFLLCLVRTRDDLIPVRTAVGLGAAAGALVLVRVDAVFLAAGVGLSYLMVWRSLPFARRVACAAAAWTAAALVGGVWFLRSYLLFGSVMPGSGAAQSLLIAYDVNAQRLVSALAQPLFPALPPVSWRFSWVAVIWLALLAAGWMWLARLAREDSPGTPLIDRGDRLAPFWFASAGWVAFYTLAFGAPHFIERYLIPLAVPAMPVLAVILGRAWRAGGRVRWPVAAVAGAALVLVVVEHALTISGSRLATRNWQYLAQYRDLTAPLPPDAIVAAGQSGTIGYYHPGTVNLDGKVNRQALLALRRGETWRYVADSNIEYVIDWPNWIEFALGPERSRWEKVGESAGFESWHRRPK